MKKLLAIIVLGLLLCGNVYADEPIILYQDNNTIHIGHRAHLTGNYIEAEKIAINHCNTHDKSMFMITKFAVTNKKPIWKNYKKKLKSTYKRMGLVYLVEAFCSNELLTEAPANSFHPGRYISHSNYISKAEQRAEAKVSGDLTFTIKDKKEQCTAIGFTPATDKFADCVLRLVELDLKTQLNNSAVASANQTNSEIADELRNQRRSDALLDLGQRLLNPSSPVSTMSTRTCSVRGTGTMKRVTCY